MNFLNHLKFTLRLFYKNLNNSVMGVVVLAAGIAISVTMFTLYNGQILSSPSFDKELFHVEWIPESENFRRSVDINVADYYALNRNNTSFEQMAAYAQRRYQLFHPEIDAGANYQAALITNNFFEVLNVVPLLGKLPSKDELESNTQKRVILSFDVWQKEFLGNADVIGKSVQLTGTPHTVIGIMPQGFRFPQAEHLWVFDDFKKELQKERKKQLLLKVFGFLKNGVGIEQAKLDFANIATSLKAEFPETNKNFSRIDIKEVNRVFADDELAQIFLMFLLFSVAVLVIACANVSNLMMARISKRQHELAIRKSLGASNRDIFIQVMSDAAIISVLGALLGTLLAAWGARYIWHMLTNAYGDWFPYWWHMDIDATVIMFAIAVTLISAFLSSIIPALKVVSNQSIEILKDNTRTSSGLSVGRMSKFMVALQIFSATVLLCMALVMLSFTEKVSDRGFTFEPEQVLANEIRLSTSLGFKSEASVEQFQRQLLNEIGAISGIKNVAFSNFVPGVYSNRKELQLDGQVYETEADKVRTAVSVISPSFFDLVNVKLLQGRNFAATDVKNSLPVILVNQHFVELYFPDENPIGKRIRVIETGLYADAKRNEFSDWMTIVGVVSNYQNNGLSYGQATKEAVADVYISNNQKTPRNMQLLVTANQNVYQHVASINKLLNKLNQKVSVRFQYRTVEDQISTNLTFLNMLNKLTKVFAFSALLMTGVGLYGLVGFTTRQKVREYAIRMALGASAKRILLLVVQQNKWPIFIGIMLGFCGGIAVSELFLSVIQLSDWQVTQWYIFPLSVLFVLLVAKLAVIIPAWKATKVPPNVALRSQ